ncbi:MAG: LamB/YcsF family protein [Anaerolineales bacterium]|nr:LamB/YcsF family protein [Anaerolineales bacterium]
MQIDLNCDLGEGVGNDEAIMPFITSANIACGFHAGDEFIMRETIRLAKRFNVNVGAHPSWEDRENFGRKEMNLLAEEAEKIVFYQIELLAKIAKEENVLMTHVKPHGALYNQSARDKDLAKAIARAIRRGEVSSPKLFTKPLILVGLAGSKLVEAGNNLGLQVAQEGFPDRGYRSDGTLMERNQNGAIIESPDKVANHAIELIKNGILFGDKVVHVDTLCLHGDHPHAAENAKLLRNVLEKNGVQIIELK